MAAIAVTGSSGFVGRHFCQVASRAGFQLRPIPREAIGGPDLAYLLRGVDSVVHLAARAHDRRASTNDLTDAFEADNVGLTQRVADACKVAGVSRFIFMSSAGVLGRSSPPEGFSDASLPAPHDAYTRSKFAAEELLRKHYAESLETVIIRPPLVYGPGAKGSFSRVMKLASSGWVLPLGAMTAPRSLISVRNLCDLLLHVVKAAEVRGGALLVADAETTNLAELVRFLRAAGGRPPRLMNVPPVLVRAALTLAGRRRDIPGLAMPFVVHASAALAELGWAPAYRLQDEILWTVGCESSVGGVR